MISPMKVSTVTVDLKAIGPSTKAHFPAIQGKICLYYLPSFGKIMRTVWYNCTTNSAFFNFNNIYILQTQ